MRRSVSFLQLPRLHPASLERHFLHTPILKTMNKVKVAFSLPHETNVVFLLSGQSFLLWMEPTHMDEPYCIISSDLFLSQVGTRRPRKGNHFFVCWWASHTIKIIFLKSATILSLDLKMSCERKITVMGRTSL